MKLENILAKRPTKTVYRDGNKSIKVFNENHSKVDVLSQALNQAKVETTSINIPKILEVTTYDGKWVIVTEYIEGKTLDVLMKEHPEKEDEYLNMFLDLQMSIHKERVGGLLKIKEKMSNKISQSNLDDAKKYELHTRLEAMPNHNKVCHGDFNPTNVILGDDGKLYVIDWSHVTQGNASADVARTYLLFCLDQGEEMANKYLDLFCKKSKTDKSYVQKWLPIVAASQSVKNIPEEKELLQKWTDVIDFQ